MLRPTGSEAHLEALQKMACRKKMALQPEGRSEGQPNGGYAALGRPYIVPEVRELARVPASAGLTNSKCPTRLVNSMPYVASRAAAR